jgi:hypothetical protein
MTAALKRPKSKKAPTDNGAEPPRDIANNFNENVFDSNSHFTRFHPDHDPRETAGS